MSPYNPKSRDRASRFSAPETLATIPAPELAQVSLQWNLATLARTRESGLQHGWRSRHRLP